MRLERGQHVAVADRGLRHRDPPRLHGQAEAEVGHHGHHHRVAGEQSPLGEVEREEGEQLVAVDERRRSASTASNRSASPSRASPRSAWCSTTAAASVAGRGRTAAVVDVGAVGFAADGGHLGAEPLEELGGEPRGRAVGAVDDQAQAVETPPFEQRGEVRDVALAEPGLADQSADPVSRKREGPFGRRIEDTRELLFDRRLHAVPELQAAGSEELDPVVGKGVVGRRDHCGRQLALGRRARRGPGSGARRRRPRRLLRSPVRPRGPPGAADPSGACRARSGTPEQAMVRATALPRARTSSGWSSTLAIPRTPSVPNRSGTGLPLGVLRSLAGLLQAVLLRLLLPRVAGEEARLLQRGAQLGVELAERRGRCRAGRRPPDPTPRRRRSSRRSPTTRRCRSSAAARSRPSGGLPR